MKAKDPIGMCIRLRQNVGGGDGPGWEPALFEVGNLNLPSMFPWEGASFIVIQLKEFPGQSCKI